MRRRSWGWYGRWYPPAPPKKPPPAHGIRIRGAGATWWGQRWMEALERMSALYSNRLPRGRTYARAGRVHDLEISQGRVTAHVTGTRATPYKVTLRLAALDDRIWAKAIAAMARQAVFSARLLAGEMPQDIDAAFEMAGVSLFPTRAADLRTDCNCPDWANPCKHVAATHYVLGAAFDKDPFLLFELRGRTRQSVLEALHAARTAAGAKVPRQRGRSATASTGIPTIATVALARSAAGEGYERLRASLSAIHFQIEPRAAHAGALRQLGPPPMWSLAVTIDDLLASTYERAGKLARALALGGRAEHVTESGDPVPSPTRPSSPAP